MQVTQNVATAKGVANGTLGTLAHVHFPEGTRLRLVRDSSTNIVVQNGQPRPRVRAAASAAAACRGHLRRCRPRPLSCILHIRDIPDEAHLPSENPRRHHTIGHGQAPAAAVCLRCGLDRVQSARGNSQRNGRHGLALEVRHCQQAITNLSACIARHLATSVCCTSPNHTRACSVVLPTCKRARRRAPAQPTQRRDPRTIPGSWRCRLSRRYRCHGSVRHGQRCGSTVDLHCIHRELLAGANHNLNCNKPLTHRH